MTHEHDFAKDLDGQITCSVCGAMDDEKEMIMKTYEEEDLSQCTRCEEMVGTETLVRLLDWSVCEICWGDL